MDSTLDFLARRIEHCDFQLNQIRADKIFLYKKQILDTRDIKRRIKKLRAQKAVEKCFGNFFLAQVLKCKIMDCYRKIDEIKRTFSLHQLKAIHEQTMHWRRQKMHALIARDNYLNHNRLRRSG